MTFWHQAPFVRLVIPLAAGIITAAFIAVQVPYSFPVILVFAVLFIFFSFSPSLYSKYVFRWVYGAFLSVLLFILGYAITISNTEILHPGHYSKILNKGDKIIAEVIEPAVTKEKSLKTTLEVKAIIKGKQCIAARGKILAYFQKDSVSKNTGYGNLLVFRAQLTEITPPQNPSEFNYKRFLTFHGIHHQAYLRNTSYRLLSNSPRNDVYGLACSARNYLMKIFEKYKITGDEYAVASALMLGSREEIDKDLVQAFASSGALHVLSVSGLHVGVIFMVMVYALAFFDKIKHGNIIKTVLLLCGLWFYAMLTGLSPSVVRAATMFSFVVAGKAGRQNTNIYNILACSAFFLLLIDPFLIMEVGFQLSYLAVLGIVFIQPRLSLLWEANFTAAGRIINWVIAQVWAITTVSIAAQVSTFALGLLYFHQFPNYFLFSNLVVIPLSTLIIYFGVMLFAVSPFEIVSGYIAFIFKSCIFLLNKSVLFVEKLPFSLLQGISISLPETWLIYFVIVLALAFFILKNIKFAKMAFVTLIILLLYQFYENHYQRKQKKFVVYNIGKTSACDFINGKENYFLADPSLTSDESRMLFHIRHHWWDLGLNENHFFNFSDPGEIKGNNFFRKGDFAQFHGKRILFINKTFFYGKRTEKMKLDYIVISGSPAITIKKLKESFDFSRIIIDASNTMYKTEKLMREAKQNNVECYAVSKNGAFIAEL